MERSRAPARAWAAGAVIVLLPTLRHGRRCAAASLVQIWTAPRPSSRSPNGRTLYRRRERARDRGDDAAWWQQRVRWRRCRNCRTRAALLMRARRGCGVAALPHFRASSMATRGHCGLTPCAACIRYI